MSKKRRVILSSDARKKKSIFGKIIFCFILLSFLGTIIYVVCYSGYLAINSVSINGVDDLNEKDILLKVDADISGTYFGNVPRDNLLFFDKNKLLEDLENSYKKIDQIKIVKKFPGSLLIEIKEHIPAIIICSREECYYLDNQGLAFMSIDPTNEEIIKKNLITFIDESNKKINLNEVIVKPDLITYLLKIKQAIKTFNEVEISSSLSTPAFISRDIRAVTDEGWRIFFNADISLGKEADMLKVVLDEKIEKNKRQDLEYVDLRSDNKVFYKFKGDYQEDLKKQQGESILQENKTSTKENKKKK